MKNLGSKYYPYVVVTLTVELTKELQRLKDDRNLSQIAKFVDSITVRGISENSKREKIYLQHSKP